MNRHFSFVLALILLLQVYLAQAQNERNWWYLGLHAAIDFSSGVPVSVNNSAMSQEEGSTTVSDANGQLLFYTNGQQIWNRNHVQMPNGFGLLGHQSSSQTLVVRKPGSAVEYYVFAVSCEVAQYGPSSFGGVSYSLVDLSLDAGNGDVETSAKNITLLDSTAEKITSIYHANGTDVWVLFHKWDSDAFYCFLLTANGIDPVPVVSHIGPLCHDIDSNGSNNEAVGCLKASPQGNKVAACSWSSEPTSLGLYDFNDGSGILSNYVPFALSRSYGCGFSPDGSKLYGSFIGTGSAGLVQWNLTATDVAASFAVIDTSYYGQMQLGPDNKLYVARYGSGFLASIHDPNAAGTACDLIINAVPTTGIIRYGITNFVEPPPVKVPNGVVAVCNTDERVFPTVAGNAIFVRNLSGATSLRIASASGQVLIEQQCSRDMVVDVSRLAPGCYFLLIDNSAHRFIKM